MGSLTKTILIGWLILNALQAAFTGLLHDEAYYWVFSKYPDWGFKDHPPVTALLVGLGSWLVDGELGVRLFMVVLSTASLYLTWRLVKPANERLFWWIVMAMPVVHLGGFVAVPDIPLMFGALLFLGIWREWLKADTWTNSLLLAVSLLFLAYTKYHGALLFLLALIPNLKVISRPRFWMICGIVILGMLPHLYWQWTHDWLTFRYHLKDRAGDIWRLKFVPEYLGGQVGIWGPFTSIFLWIAVFRLKSADNFERSLKWIVLGFAGFFFMQSWNQPTEANWTAPIFLGMIWFGYRWLSERPKWATWAVRGSMVTLVLIFILRIFLVWDFLPREGRQAQEFHHWDEWAMFTSEIIGEDATAIFTNRYQRPSKYMFYSGRPTYCVTTDIDTGTQFDLLYEMEESVQGKSVCIINENPGQEAVYDTIVQQTPSGRPLGFRWRDDFRSYNRVWCRIARSKYVYPPDTTVTLPVEIINPTDKVISWDTTGQRAVTFNYLFIDHEQIIHKGMALTNWPTTSLEPGETFPTTITFTTPSMPKIYRFRLAWEVAGLLQGKNSGFYEFEIVE